MQTYKQVQTTLKDLRNNGYNVQVPLNGRKEVLEAEIERLSQEEAYKYNEKALVDQFNQEMGLAPIQEEKTSEKANSFGNLVTCFREILHLAFVQLLLAYLAMYQAQFRDWFLDSTWDLRFIYKNWGEPIVSYLAKDSKAVKRQIAWVWERRVLIMDKVFCLD